jgi:hypothetical protein
MQTDSPQVHETAPMLMQEIATKTEVYTNDSLSLSLSLVLSLSLFFLVLFSQKSELRNSRACRIRNSHVQMQRRAPKISRTPRTLASFRREKKNNNGATQEAKRRRKRGVEKKKKKKRRELIRLLPKLCVFLLPPKTVSESGKRYKEKTCRGRMRGTTMAQKLPRGALKTSWETTGRGRRRRRRRSHVLECVLEAPILM